MDYAQEEKERERNWIKYWAFISIWKCLALELFELLWVLKEKGWEESEWKERVRIKKFLISCDKNWFFFVLWRKNWMWNKICNLSHSIFYVLSSFISFKSLMRHAMDLVIFNNANKKLWHTFYLAHPSSWFHQFHFTFIVKLWV